MMEKKTKFKSLSPKAQLEYIWDYYRWHIIGGLLGTAFILSLVIHYVTYEAPLLNVIMINCLDPLSADSSGFDEFLENYGYDNSKTPISLSSSLTFPDGNTASSLQEYQALTLMAAAGDQDLFFGTGDVFLNIANQGVLMDLSLLLSKEELTQYADNLIYTTDEITGKKYPCAIELTNHAWLSKHNYYETCYFGVFLQGEPKEAVTQFIKFILHPDQNPLDESARAAH